MVTVGGRWARAGEIVPVVADGGGHRDRAQRQSALANGGPRMTHEECLESSAAYALGALDASERSAFEAHLGECTTCSAELDDNREVAGLLAYAAPMVSLPNVGALRERIIGDAAKTRPLASAASRLSAPGLREASASAYATAPRLKRTPGSRLPWLAAAASLTIAVVSGAAYFDTRRDSAQLSRALETTRLDAERTRAILAARDSVLSAFLSPSVHVVSLSDGAEKKPAARIFWNHSKDVFIITAFNVPQAPQGRVYQLWAMKKGKAPLSMGTFNSDSSGRALAILPVGNIADAGVIDGCAMTLEPEGGSKQPTETPRLLGAWRHAD